MSSAELSVGVHGEVLSDESFRGPLVDAVAVQTLRDKACGGLGGAGDWKLWAGFHSLCVLVSCDSLAVPVSEWDETKAAPPAGP